MIDSYATQAQKYFENHFFAGKSLDALNYSLLEAFNNINDHAESSIKGYVTSQYYPQKKQMITAICDFGIGIPTAINRYLTLKGKENLNDDKSIEYATIKGNSSRTSTHNQGHGLTTICSIVQSLKGNLVIKSQKGIFWQDPNGTIYTKIATNTFNGTLIIIIFDTNNLPYKEKEVEDEFYF